MTFAFAAFGLIIGSFLNVLILRHGSRSLSGRSTCTACGATIAWYDLIPVVSWLMLRGSCRTCGGRLSAQYPLVEGGTAVLFALVGAAPITLPFKILALPIVALFLAIAVYDLRTTIIPNAWVGILGFLTLFIALSSAGGDSTALGMAFVSGPLAAAPLFLLWYVSKGAWMGLGDAKLALSMGWLLGIPEGLVAVFFAFVIGAAVALPLLFFSSRAWKRMFRDSSTFEGHTHATGGEDRYTMKSEIPFGPFLVASSFLIWFADMYGLGLSMWSLIA